MVQTIKVSRRRSVRALAAAGVLALSLGVPAVAGAQTTDDDGAVSASVENTVVPKVPPTEVAPKTITPEVLGEVEVRDTGLAVTGTDAIGLSVIGAGAIAIGSAILLSRRRSNA